MITVVRSVLVLRRAGAALLLLCTSAFAQQRFVGMHAPEVFDNGPIKDWVTSAELEGSPFSRERFKDVYAADILDGRISEVAERMIEHLRQSPWEAEHEAVKRKILKQLDAFLIELRAASRAPGIEGPVDTQAERETFVARLNQSGLGIITLTLGQDDDRPVYFNRRSTDPNDWLYLYEQLDEVPMGDPPVQTPVWELPLPEKWMREWRLLENALTDLLDKQITLVRAENVRTLELAVENWEKYLDRGYSMYPWESLLNGYVLRLPQQGPPDRQWILLHPTLGIEASAHALDDVRIKESAVIEIAGHLWYTDDYSSYYGISATTSLREDIDPSLGVLLHLRRNWNIGVSWHSVDDDPFIFFSVDLFRFASDKVGKLRDKFGADRKQLLGR